MKRAERTSLRSAARRAKQSTKWLIAIALLAACDQGEHRAARDKYNEGVALLAKGDLDAAEKALLDARSQAGVDPELRFRAAYDLGMAYAADADKARGGKEPDLAKALELEQQAVSWFADAQRLEAVDKDTATNLAITRARVQAISDELRKGEGKLEKRLDAVIAQQRGVLGGAREAWMAIKAAGGADPLAQQGALTHLADVERGIVAEAGVIGDLADDEIDAIGKKPDDKRSDEEKVRVVQLKNLDTYLLDGRGKIAEARRKLQELAAQDAVAKAEGAIVALKRAREQLLDPITVLRELAGDEAALMQETAALAKASSLTEAGGPVPAWLEGKAQGERQGGLRDRLEEVRARFAAGVSSLEQQVQPHEVNGQSVAGKPVDPKQAKVMERVKAALPSVIEASGAMDRARGDLSDKQVAKAADDERTALLALAKAIEEFADLKQTIDLAWEEQERVVQLLGPEGAQVPDRARETGDGVRRNLARVERLKSLVADELAQLAEQRDQKADDKDPKQAEAHKQALEQERQKLAYAETLRGQAADAIAKLDKALGDAKADPLAQAKDADSKLTELRKLFFSVIEHLEQLIRDQGETHDQTAATSAEDDFARAPKLPGLIGREDDHGKMAKAITDALAAQADAAAKQQGQPQQGPSPKALAGAADEVRLAHNDMSDAQMNLTKAKEATTKSMSLDPATKSEAKAIEHLTSALKLLQPPPKQNEQKQDDKKQQDEQKKQDDKKQQEQQQQQQGGPGQRARDDDARRQKERQKQQRDSEPVDQDW